MKIILTILVTLTVTSMSVAAQNEDFESLLLAGKAEFKKEFEKQDYKTAVELLERAVQLKPDNAEAHYFLGYAYSRLNAKDGNSMVSSNLSLILKSSAEFETVTTLAPKYSGEIIILDQYSKLTSEWGSLAMSYWHSNKPDSAKWAFREGKKRGGFGDFFLGINRSVLDLCSKNAILISSGDNFTIPLWYLQIMEGYRSDVSVIDVSLLNSPWYPRHVVSKGLLKFDVTNAVLDQLEYCEWSDTIITIGKFSWIVKPSYEEHYLLRGDRILLSMLRANKFKRDIFFTIGFNEDSRVGLGKYVQPMILTDKLMRTQNQELPFDKYKTEISKILLHVRLANKNSTDQVGFIDNIRYEILNKANMLLRDGKKKEAKEIVALLDTYASEKDYPYHSAEGKKYADMIHGAL